MQKIALLLACLSCTGWCQRWKTSRQSNPSSENLKIWKSLHAGPALQPFSGVSSEKVVDHCKDLVSVLSALNPAGAFTHPRPRMHFPRGCAASVGSRRMLGRRAESDFSVPEATNIFKMRMLQPSMFFGSRSLSQTPIEALRQMVAPVSWLSWWTQAILTTVSAVLLLFANSVGARPTLVVLTARTLAVGGLGFSILSTLWTWRYRRLAKSLAKEPETPAATAAETLLSIAKWGIPINLLGMGLSLLGAEAIIGTLAAKALTQNQAVQYGMVAAGAVQPLDMLIVQASINIIVAHFASLLAGLQLRGEALKSGGSPELAAAA